MNKLSLRDVPLDDRIAVVRVDFNVPLDASSGTAMVTDDTRIRAALPTINFILENGGHPVLLSHLGRPKGNPDPKYSLEPVGKQLAKLTNRKVRLVTDFDNPSTVRDAFDSGADIVLIENTRFEAGETKNDSELAKAYAALGDLYVNDAFGTAHRAHASTVGIAEYVDTAAMGFLLEREVDYLSRLLDEPERPFVAIIGGAKVSDKIGVIENLLQRVDRLLIGGAMSYTFIKSQGGSIGKSLVEDDRIDDAADLLARASGKIVLPVDHIAATAFDNDAEHEAVAEIPDDLMGLDIGPKTMSNYREIIMRARTVVWNGPMGVFEMPSYSRGTIAVARALADATRDGALTVVGGGDSVAAISQAGLDDDVSHVSTGGGAMLEFLEGKTLPGVAALSDAVSS
ncbi:MAG: phosphoglycerate kinase [Bacteroidetes bacterium]|nr:phosphoglycerate kinase [Bacteroidota bacterium]